MFLKIKIPRFPNLEEILLFSDSRIYADFFTITIINLTILLFVLFILKAQSRRKCVEETKTLGGVKVAYPVWTLPQEDTHG
jgi:hypothetical protein